MSKILESSQLPEVLVEQFPNRQGSALAVHGLLEKTEPVVRVPKNHEQPRDRRLQVVSILDQRQHTLNPRDRVSRKTPSILEAFQRREEWQEGLVVGGLLPGPSDLAVGAVYPLPVLRVLARKTQIVVAVASDGVLIQSC